MAGATHFGRSFPENRIIVKLAARTGTSSPMPARELLIAIPTTTTVSAPARITKSPEERCADRALPRASMKRAVRNGIVHTSKVAMWLALEKKPVATRSEEQTSELQSLMRISYAVVCLKKKTDTPSSSRRRMYTHTYSSKTSE